VATLGEINFRLAKEFPGTDADVRLGIINDRYQEILERLPWSRLDVETVIQTVAQYATGTVAVVAGGTALTFTGSTITAAMSGRQIHIGGRSEAYTFTYASASTGTIDRPYEGGEDATASGFVISQPILTLPSSCRIVRSLRNLSLPTPLTRRDRSQADFTDPARIAVGQPRQWNDWMDANTTPPPPQVELSPAPDAVYSILVSYTAEQAQFGLGDTSVALLPWTQPGALMAGCRADLAMLADPPRVALAETSEAKFEQRVEQMVNNESRRQGPAQMSMQDAYTRHRQARWAQPFRNQRQIL